MSLNQAQASVIQVLDDLGARDRAIEELKDAVTESKDRVVALEGDKSSLESEVGYLQARVNDMSIEKDQLEDTVTQLRYQIQCQAELIDSLR